MTQELKDEVLEHITSEVMFGFNNKAKIFDRIMDAFYDEGGIDEDWLKQEIEKAYTRRQQESKSWVRPTDFDKLAAVFDNLCKQNIIALHRAGYTKQDGYDDCKEVNKILKAKGITAEGYCFYNEQDMGGAIDEGVRNMYLAYDSVDGNNDSAKTVACTILNELKKQGLNVAWNGDVNKRIEIQNIIWQKVPDEQEWGMQRAINMMSPNKNAKAWWKFW